MTTKISNQMLSELSSFVADRFGLYFPRERWHDLERHVGAAAQECRRGARIEPYIQDLLSSALSRNEMETLVAHLTVGETYFFREKQGLEIVREHIVPDLVRVRAGRDRQLRVWSAGCSTGEEPYSVAILLNSLVAMMQGWNVRILATDLNAKSLRKAAEGTYGEWAFRGTPQWVRSGYFQMLAENQWALVPAIKKMVTFADLNLAEDAYPSPTNDTQAFDVILCRNVLMYLTPETTKRVIEQLHRSLADSGWLIVSPAETSHALFSAFAPVNFGEVTLYQKRAGFAGTAFDSFRHSAISDHDWSGQFLQPQIETSAIGSALEPASHRAKADSEPQPDISPRSCGRAMELYNEGRYEQAEQMARTLLLSDSSEPKTLLLVARCCANQGRLSEALEACEKAIAADRMGAPAHYLRATILQEQGSPDEAVSALMRAVYADAMFVMSHFALGNFAMKQGRFEEAEKHFENTLLLLARHRPEEIVPESDGLSAGLLREIVCFQLARRTMTSDNTAALPSGEHPQKGRQIR